MSDTLLIDFSDASSIGWAKFSDGVQIDKGEVAELSNLVDYANNHEVIIWINPAKVTFASLNIPAGQQRHLQRILPSLLEDNLASDIDDLHFTSGSISAEGDVHVAVIDRKQLEEDLAEFHDVGLKPQAILSASLAVPYSDEGSSLHVVGETSVLRTGSQMSYHFDTQNMATLLPMITGSTTSPLALYISEQQRKTIEIAHAVDWRGEPINKLAQIPNKSTLEMNLLQGEFQPQSDIDKHWKYWRSVVFIAIAALVVQLVTVGIETMTLNQQAKGYKTEIADVFHNAFPDEKRLINPKAQMMQQLKKLQPQRGDAGFLMLLQQLAPALQQANKVTVTRINFERRQGQLRMDIKASEYTQLEQLKDAASKIGLHVELGAVSGNNGAYTAKLLVKAQ